MEGTFFAYIQRRGFASLAAIRIILRSITVGMLRDVIAPCHGV
jgi:hypothetical protein